jgi:hypothetical protein
MKRIATALVLLGFLAAGSALAETQDVSISSFASQPIVYQYGDDFGYGGGGGGGSAARSLNMRVSLYFIALVLQATDAMDISSGDPDPWTHDWSTGLGGGIEFAYQLAPGFRVGFGSGYHVFPGKEDDFGWGTADYGGIQCIPLRVEAAVCFPFQSPSGSWFQAGKGYVPGPVPYVGVELAGVYRSAVDVEVTAGSLSSDGEIMASSFAFFFGGRMGFEFRGPNWGVFLDFGFRLYTPPGEGEDLGSGVEILNMYAFPIRMGFAFYFGGTGGAYY